MELITLIVRVHARPAQEHTLQFEKSSGPDQAYWRAYHVESALGNNTRVQSLNISRKAFINPNKLTVSNEKNGSFQMLRLIYLRYLRYQISLITEIRAVRHRSSFMFCTVNRSVVLARFSTSAIMSSDLDVVECFEFAKELTLQAGKILECSFEDEKVVYDKGEWDFVTDHDYKIEKIFMDGLSKKYPDHKIIAEETVTAMQKMPELTDAPTWFLDPIDGTTNFIHLFPHFCISIALTVRKELVLGIIYNPSNSELYSAIKGKGAFLNGKSIRTSKVTELKKALLMIDPSIIKLIGKNKDIHKARVDALIEVTQGTRNIGSAALTLAYIARGVSDCFQQDYLKAWDVAAGTLIIREAGGTLLDTKGGAYDIMNPKTIAASNETLAREISKIIVDTDLKTQRKRLKRT